MFTRIPGNAHHAMKRRQPLFLLEMRGHQIIGTSASANINPRGDGTDQIAVRIERSQEARFIGSGIGLDSGQRVFFDEKRCFDGAVVSPKSHGTPRLVVGAAMVWKINHAVETDRIAAG